MTETRRGALIVVEGLDKSGKSTQCQMLVDALRKDGKKVELLKFPARQTLIGQMINDYLQQKCELDDRAIHLLFSANRWEFASRIIDSLNSGTHIVVDRYAFSGVAYSSAKKGISTSWCVQPDKGLPKPDVVFFLSVPAEIAATREAFGSERYEMADFQKKVANSFRRMTDETWVAISSERSESDVHAEMKSRTDIAIDECCSKRVQELWT